MTHLLSMHDGTQPLTVDGERVCEMIGSLPSRGQIVHASDTLGVLADPTKLTLLACLVATGEACVRDLAAATSSVESTVSHALRILRAHGIVDVRRHGRLALYRITDDRTVRLLEVLLDPTTAASGR